MLVNSEKIILTWNLMKRSRKKIKIKMSSPEPTSQTAKKICLTFLLDDFLMFSDRKWWNCHKRMFGCLLTFYLHQKKSFWKVFSRTKLHKTLWDVTKLLSTSFRQKLSKTGYKSRTYMRKSTWHGSFFLYRFLFGHGVADKLTTHGDIHNKWMKEYLPIARLPWIWLFRSYAFVLWIYAVSGWILRNIAGRQALHYARCYLSGDSWLSK